MCNFNIKSKIHFHSFVKTCRSTRRGVTPLTDCTELEGLSCPAYPSIWLTASQGILGFVSSSDQSLISRRKFTEPYVLCRIYTPVEDVRLERFLSQMSISLTFPKGSGVVLCVYFTRHAAGCQSSPPNILSKHGPHVPLIKTSRSSGVRYGMAF